MRNVILLLLSAIFRIRKACNFILQEKKFCPTFFDGILIFLRLSFTKENYSLEIAEICAFYDFWLFFAVYTRYTPLNKDENKTMRLLHFFGLLLSFLKIQK